MKKLMVSLLLFPVLGVFLPTFPALAKSKPNVSVSIIEEGNDLKMAAKVSKKSNKDKKENTKRREKKLKELGINKPKSYLNYGKDLSLNEFGKIIGKWIVDVWVKTGQLPDKLLNDPPSWLMVNINGECISASDTCARWGN